MARHVHADLIEVWVKDTSKIVQYYSEGHQCWYDCIDNDPSWNQSTKHRFKPREFKEGHWYQVSIEWGDYEDDLVLKFKGGEFHYDNIQYSPEQFKWIGESLGELKFG